jgi:hypothetical protein
MAQSRYKTNFAQVDSSVTAVKLIYDDGDLRVQGLDRSGSLVIELHFRDVLLTRVTPEGVRLRLLPELKTVRGFVLTDEQSELITWVHEEGLRTRDMREAKHFLIVFPEEIVDVVALSDPQISKART